MIDDYSIKVWVHIFNINVIPLKSLKNYLKDQKIELWGNLKDKGWVVLDDITGLSNTFQIYWVMRFY